MFKRIDHVEIVTDQLERTAQFYTEVLGFYPRSHGGIAPRTRSGIGRKKEPFGEPPEALPSCCEKRIGPEAEPAGAASHASATARRAPIVRAAS
jgi:catechol 2,3-dioxygenase-like lactoylglutathione lyase family enzyme